MRGIILIMMLFLVQTIFSQEVRVSGKVVEQNGITPIGYATVSLFKTDSTIVKGVNTNLEGCFIIQGIDYGDYILSISLMGYEPFITNINNLTQSIDLGNIILYESSIALTDVTVTGNAVIQKADRQLIMPTATQVKTSANAMELLEKLHLARLKIDPIEKTVSVLGGGNVQLRINGVEVTNAEIVALLSEDIIRIEYHDSPGMRYGNAAAVIDYITRKKESGGNVSLNLNNVVTGFDSADDFISAKFNHKKSEFGINGYFRYRGVDWTRENNERFVLPTQTIERTEKGKPTGLEDKVLNLALNYILQEQDKYLLNVMFRNKNNDNPKSFEDRESTVFTTNNSTPLDVSDQSSFYNNAPSLDVYYMHNLKNNQAVILNVVGTYIDSKSTRTYKEYRDNQLMTDIFSDIRGDKYSLIAEGIYERQLTNGKLSAGIKHTQSYTDNEYMGNVITSVGLNQAETYAYTEYQLKHKKFNYTFGVGASRNEFIQKGKSNNQIIFRPTFRINYTPSDILSMRYNAYISSYPPSLSDLNDVEQNIDSIQIRRGNPNLKTVKFFSNELSVGFKKGIFGIDLFARYSYDDKPVMESLFIENGKVIRTNNNHKGFHRFNSMMSFKIQPLKEYITINLNPGFNRYISLGNDYTHTYNNWFFHGSIEANYKNWVFSADMNSRYNWFWGETLSKGEFYSGIGVGYNTSKWSAGATCMWPLNKTYSTGGRNYSAIAPSSSSVFTDNVCQAIRLRFSYNISFGRQYQASNKRINNDDSDSGIMSGKK